jgi:hypothetical protein
MKKLLASHTRLREFLMDRTKEEMRGILKDLTSESLKQLSRVAMPGEDYEVCQVVQELLNERKKIKSGQRLQRELKM